MSEMPHLRPIDSDSDGQTAPPPQAPPEQQEQPPQQDYRAQEPSTSSASTGSTEGLADVLVDACVKFFSSADDVLSRRLAASHTVVHIHLNDADDRGFTIFFDEHPARSETGYVGQAETNIYSTTENWMKVILGQEHLGLLIAKGHIEYEGPVRKFLRATPMMRRLDVDQLRPVAQAARERRKSQSSSQEDQS